MKKFKKNDLFYFILNVNTNNIKKKKNLYIYSILNVWKNNII